MSLLRKKIVEGVPLVESGQRGNVEVRGFSFIKELFDSRGLPFPFFVEIEDQCTAAELAQRLEIPPNMLEAVFINGVSQGTGGMVRPGDRVAFVPPGTPGPYRVVLGLIKDHSKKQ